MPHILGIQTYALQCLFGPLSNYAPTSLQIPMLGELSMHRKILSTEPVLLSSPWGLNNSEPNIH